MDTLGTCPNYACVDAGAETGAGAPYCTHDYSVVPHALVVGEREAAQFLQCDGHTSRCQLPHPFRLWPSVT